MCLSHLIYTVRPCLIHTCHAMPMPCSDHAVLLKATAQHSTAVLCCGLEKNGMVGAWHGHGMAIVNQTRPHRVNQMGKTHSKPFAARHGRGMGKTRYVWMSLYAEEWLIFSSRWADSTCLISLHAIFISKNLFYVFHIHLFYKFPGFLQIAYKNTSNSM